MDLLNAWTDRARALWSEALDIWSDGGWAMIAIAFIAVVMFGVGLHVALRLWATRFRSVPEREWRRWIVHPRERRGPIGELLDLTTGAVDLESTTRAFEEVRATKTQPFERDLKVMKTCVSAAPLVGLLGTVTGMLSTFGALSSGSGGDKTMQMVAKGISEALITTETGLVIALPGLFFQYQLQRRFESYKAFLAHVESVCAQTIYRHTSRGQRSEVRRVAVRQVAARLLAGMGALRAPKPSLATAAMESLELQPEPEDVASPRSSAPEREEGLSLEGSTPAAARAAATSETTTI